MLPLSIDVERAGAFIEGFYLLALHCRFAKQMAALWYLPTACAKFIDKLYVCQVPALVLSSFWNNNEYQLAQVLRIPLGFF